MVTFNNLGQYTGGTIMYFGGGGKGREIPGTHEIREYAEGYPVYVHIYEGKPDVEGVGRWVITAINEGGHNGTGVDLIDLLKWVKKNHPEIWNEIE